MESGFVQQLTLIIVAAAAFAVAARRRRLPTIVAYLAAGLLLGPATGWVEATPSLETFSEAGIVLLLFLVGLELSLDKIKGLGTAVLWAGVIQVGATAVAGFLISLLLGMGLKESLFLAMAVIFSSTVVVVKLLEEKHQLDHLHGRIAVGILLLQDLVVIALLTLTKTFEPGVPLSLGTLGWNVLKALGAMGALLAATMATARYVLPRPFAWAARSPATLLIWSLCWCFFVVVAAHWLHLSPESGAFLAGLALAQLPYNHDLRRRVHPLMNFFIAVFFVALGLRMPIAEAAGQWWPALVLTLFVLGGKFLIVAFSLARLRFSERTSFLTALSLTQISEFSFILAASAMASGWVGADMLSLVGLVGLASIALSSSAIVFQEPLYVAALKRGWLRFLRAAKHDPERPHGHSLHQHIIVVGMNTLGRDIARRLHARGETVLAIDTDPRKLADLPCETCLGNADYLSVLEDAGLESARLLVSALRIEPANDLLAYRCRQFNIPAAIQVVDLSVVDNLLEMDVRYMMIPKIDGMKLQNRVLQEDGFLPG